MKSELLQIPINGLDQALLIQQSGPEKPWLFFLHGGPGSVLLPFSYHFDRYLLESFNVLHWDQRGAGKSFHPSMPETGLLDVQILVEDIHSITKLIKERYKAKSIHLLGHSWGSILGLYSIQKHSDLFSSYVGIGQVINDVKAQNLGVQWLNNLGENTTELKNSIPLEKFEQRMAFSQMLMKHGGIFHSLKMEDLGAIAQDSPHYSKEDWVGQEAGMKFSQSKLNVVVNRFDARDFVIKKLPSIFIHGAHDQATPLSLVEDFAAGISSRNAKVIQMKGSAHFPFWEEPELFCNTLRTHLYE